MNSVNELAITGLRNEFKGIVNICHVLHSLLCNSFYWLSDHELSKLLEKRKLQVYISDSMVIDFLNNAAASDIHWLYDLLESSGLEKGMKFTLYKFQSDDDDPKLFEHVLSIELIDSDDYINFDDEETGAEEIVEAVAKEPAPMVMAKSAGA